MPTYEYQCNQCEKRFEKYQSITAKPVKICPECGGRVKRLIGAGAAIISKGSSSSPEMPSCEQGGSCESCPYQE